MESAKEIASKHLGKNAINYITLLVLIGVVSSMFLESSVLPAVIGLVATSSMALIGILQHIVGAKEKEDKPEITIIKELITEVSKDKTEPMKVDVENGKVTVSKGKDIITNKTKEHGHTMHKEGSGHNNAKAKKAKEIISNPQKSKAMKKAKPNLPASSMLQAPVAAGKVVKKAAKKAVAKAIMKKAAKKKK
jgi:hypothetical protein